MFDFEKLEVYQTIKTINLKVLTFLFHAEKIDQYLVDQWKRASVGALLNLAEGTGRMNTEDKKHLYTLARGCIFECTAILDLLHEMEQIDDVLYEDIYKTYEQSSKMLLAMYRSMDR
jgi:four helix bundle protein